MNLRRLKNEKINRETNSRIGTIQTERGTYVYLPIRKVYSTWYVRLFHVNNLLKENQLPSYWYRGLGDCTETEAIKNGYESLIKLNWR